MLNNNNTKINVQGVQLVRCVMFHSSKNSYVSFLRFNQVSKGFITYNLEHSITAIKKHVTNEHGPDLVK